MVIVWHDLWPLVRNPGHHIGNLTKAASRRLLLILWTTRRLRSRRQCCLERSAAGILCFNNHNYSAVEYSRKWFRFHHKLFIAFKSILNYDICICEIKTIENVKYFACVWFSLSNMCSLLSL